MAQPSDTKKFRKALKDAGFSDKNQHLLQYAATIFNDKRKSNRRLKLWNGNTVAAAPHKQKVKLVDHLITQFGDRLISVNTITGPRYYGYMNSVVVKLKL